LFLRFCNEVIAVNNYTVELKKRSALGTANSKRLRAEGFVPSVVYAHDQGSVPVLLSGRDFFKQAETARISQIFTLKSDDGAIDGRPALVKEIQRCHLSGKLLHVDFLALREDEEVTVEVPVEFKGEAIGVKSDGGILSVVAHEIAVICLPKNIPAVVSVDVSALKIGQSIHAGDIALPADVRLGGDVDETVVSVVAVRQVEEAAAAAPGAAPAEGAAAPAAAAPAAGEEKKEAAPAKKK
jgi:large subunit ribosomal protein L25